MPSSCLMASHTRSLACSDTKANGHINKTLILSPHEPKSLGMQAPSRDAVSWWPSRAGFQPSPWPPGLPPSAAPPSGVMWGTPSAWRTSEGPASHICDWQWPHRARSLSQCLCHTFTQIREMPLPHTPEVPMPCPCSYACLTSPPTRLTPPMPHSLARYRPRLQTPKEA